MPMDSAGRKKGLVGSPSVIRGGMHKCYTLSMPRKSVFIVALTIAVAVTISVLCFTILFSKQPLPTMSIDRVYDVTAEGQMVLVNVTLKDVPSTLGCRGWMLNLTWNPDIAKLTTAEVSQGPIPENQYVALTEGPFLRSAGTTYFILNYADNDRGEAVVSSMLSDSGTNASRTGVILMMNFTVVHVGTTTIEFNPPTQSSVQSVVIDAQGHLLDHIETNGLITKEAKATNNLTYMGIILSIEIIVFTIVTVLLIYRGKVSS
jgi:hypothetical protein